MFDKYKKRYQAPKAGERVRRQIAVEAARRMFEAIAPDPDDPSGRLRDATEGGLLHGQAEGGRRPRASGPAGRPAVRRRGPRRGPRPGRAIARAGSRSRGGPARAGRGGRRSRRWPTTSTGSRSTRCGSRPLESVKQNPKYHPEGDALYHSLQVFELRPRGAAIRRGVPPGRPPARRRQGDRPGRPRRRPPSRPSEARSPNGPSG